jgi:hypothetical protein
LGGEGNSSKCGGQGGKNRNKGAAREIVTNQQDRRIDLEVCRAWLSAIFVFLGWAIIPGRESKLIIINLTELIFPSGVFRGYLPINLLYNVYGFRFIYFCCMFSLNNSVVLLFNKSVLLVMQRTLHLPVRQRRARGRSG